MICHEGCLFFWEILKTPMAQNQKNRNVDRKFHEFMLLRTTATVKEAQFF